MSHVPQTVLVTGASGFVGRHLCRRLLARGARVIALVHRTPLPADLHGVQAVPQLDAIEPGAPVDAVVNLAGARILGAPWTAGRRRLLRDSRLRTTDALVQWMQRRGAPAVLVSASAVGYYGVRDRTPVDESAGPQAEFQSALCRDWEVAALAAPARVVLLRFGVVLGRDGGALPPLLLPARFGLGAVLGDGRQGFPWLHIADAVGLIEHALATPALAGPVNAVAPEAVSQEQFQRALCARLRRPLWLRVPAAPLRLLGEMSRLLVEGQYVLPRHAAAAGYVWQQPQLSAALADLLAPSAGRSE